MKSNEVRQEIKMYQANDFEVEEETSEYVLMKKHTGTLGGHLLVFLLTVWWTLGIGNLVYYLLSNKTKKIMK
jgi:hypothetical protein